MPQKRTRTVLSLEEKKKVIKIKEDNPTFTLNEVAEAYYKQSKKVISQTTVGTIWNNRQAIMSGLPYNMKGKKQDISISAETMCKIEEAEASHKTVSESLVIELAQKVVLEHKLDPKLYFFSPAWARGIMHGKVDDKSILKVNQKSIENATVLTKPSSIEPAEKSASQLSGLERLLAPSAAMNAAFLEDKYRIMKGEYSLLSLLLRIFSILLNQLPLSLQSIVLLCRQSLQYHQRRRVQR